MAMAQKVVKEIIIQNHPQEITVDRVLNEVAAVFKITPEDIRSTNRSKNISRARKVAIYLLKEVKGMTYLDIGNELNKNHSTMTIHYQSITEETARNKDLKHIIEDLEKNLKNN